MTVLENLVLTGPEQAGERIWNAWCRPGTVGRQEDRIIDQALAILDYVQLGHLRDVYAGRLFYGKDAFEGLHVMDRLGAIRRGAESDDPDWGRVPSESRVPSRASLGLPEPGAEDGEPVELPSRSPDVLADNEVFVPPFVGSRVVKGLSLDEIAGFVNETALFRNQWQFRPEKLADGSEVVPLKVVKACLPDPASLAPNYEGKTCIGDFVKGVKDGKERTVFIYNVADHKEAYEEVGSQGISYTAGVPPVAAAMLVATGEWDVKKMANVEELPPRPFLNILNRIGLQTCIRDEQGERELHFD